MTREEAVKIFNTVLFLGRCDCQKEEIEECLRMAIKALEQEPREDCISRQAVLDKLNRLIEVERLQGTDEMGYGRERVSAYENMMFEIESEYLYPSVTPQERKAEWIPCSERLPEEDKEVLISYRYKEGEGDTSNVSVDITTYGQMYFGGNKVGNHKHWRAPFEYFESNYEVFAWMPLPAPYKAESEDE